MPLSFSAPQRPAPTKPTPTGPTNPPTIAPAVSHGIARPCPRSPAAQLAVLKSDIVAYTTLAASGIVSSGVPSASLTGRPMPNRPTETGGGRTGAVLGGSSTGTTVSTSIRQWSPKKRSNKQLPPKPNLAENCHAAHRGGDRQVLPALFGSTAEENFQGKTRQRGSAANFLPAHERQHKQEAAITHGVCWGRRDHQELPLPVIFRGKGLILFSLSPDQDCEDKNLELAKDCHSAVGKDLLHLHSGPAGTVGCGGFRCSEQARFRGSGSASVPANPTDIPVSHPPTGCATPCITPHS